MNTHYTGEITELQVAESFLKHEIQVCKPLVSDSRYDFIVDIKGTLYRIQVKTSALTEDGAAFKFKTQSTHTNTKRTVCHSYSAKDVDFFATMCNNQCYIVPINLVGKRACTLRFKPTSNGQIKNINFAENFTLENMLLN